MKQPLNAPSRVTIELTNRCNRNCNLCPRTQVAAQQGFMDYNLFEKVIKQLDNKTVIVPFFRGETMLHPQFPRFMKHLKTGKFRHVQLASNCDLLTGQNVKAVKGTCSFFSCSLHSLVFACRAKPELLNFLSFLRETGKGRRRKVETQVSILECLVPEALLDEFVKDWKHHVDHVRLYKTHSLNGFGSMKDEKKTFEACIKPFTEMAVYWNGEVGLCNHDWDNSFKVGNLNTSTIQEVWNSDNYKQVRRLHATGKRRLCDVCKSCDFNFSLSLNKKSKKERNVYGEVF